VNYRHHFHAGNFADVVKHVLLLRLLRALQQKPKGFVYLDTHAGRGAYDLTAAATGDSLARTPEWPEGIGRLWSRTDLPPAVAEYVGVVRDFDRGRGGAGDVPQFYPGSPWIAGAVAREVDRLALCEKHPDECRHLAAEFEHARNANGRLRVSVQEMDGYVATRAMLPPPERRALILIDPPYEAQDEYALATSALHDGLTRFPSGVFALWYPLTQRARVQEFLTAIEGLRPPPTLVAELGIAGDFSARKLKGCGLAIVNPPWQFDREARSILDYLSPVLAQEPGGGAHVNWLVPEK
jgi:23S rRNA (adenine2030-N6)-methyltransferase